MITFQTRISLYGGGYLLLYCLCMTEIPQSNIQETAPITSDNFTQYLINRVDRDRSSFPLTLDLSPFSETFKKVFAERQTVSMLDEENQEKLRTAQALSKTGPLHQTMEDLLNLEGEAERACVIYLDPNSDTIDTSPIVHGNHTSVQGQVVPVIIEDKFPLVDIHTHPNDDTFSPQDYDTLLRDLFLSGSDVHGRMVGALVVIAKNFQYLAVPTTDTPLVPLDGDLDAILGPLATPTEAESVHLSHLENRAKKMREHMSQAPTLAMNQHMEKIAAFDGMIANGEISFEQALEKAKRLEPQFVENLKNYMNKITNVVIRANNSALDYNSDLIDKSIKKAPGDLNIVLYRSTDFNHFEQFNPLAVTDQS